MSVDDGFMTLLFARRYKFSLPSAAIRPMKLSGGSRLKPAGQIYLKVDAVDQDSDYSHRGAMRQLIPHTLLPDMPVHQLCHLCFVI